jgi:DNA invertase Pin-like site-specific DNA recombinase
VFNASQDLQVTFQIIGYQRVSSADQNEARQLAGVEVHKMFTDKASGKDLGRPQLTAMLAHVRSGDQLHVHSMDRLSRNMIDLIGTVTALVDRGVTIHFHKEGLKFEPSAEGDSEAARAMKRLQLSIMGAVAEFERSMIRERQREGIAAAKAAGKYKGSAPKLTDQQAIDLRARIEAGVPVARAAREAGISRTSAYTYLKAGSSPQPAAA